MLSKINVLILNLILLFPGFLFSAAEPSSKPRRFQFVRDFLIYRGHDGQEGSLRRLKTKIDGVEVSSFFVPEEKMPVTDPVVCVITGGDDSGLVGYFEEEKVCGYRPFRVLSLEGAGLVFINPKERFIVPLSDEVILKQKAAGEFFLSFEAWRASLTLK